MTEQSYRLGDPIDDYCPRCRLLLNHAVASLVEGEVAKVICQTCYTEHPFHEGKSAKKKKPATGRATLFDQVLARTGSTPAADPPGNARQNPKRKKPAPPTRYISRHKAGPPKKGR